MAASSDHQKHEMRSLRFHEEAARMIAADASLLLVARAILLRWKAERGMAAPSLLDEWLAIIERGPEATIEMMTSHSEPATRLRQSSPFASLLPQPIREAIIKKTS